MMEKVEGRGGATSKKCRKEDLRLHGLKVMEKDVGKIKQKKAEQKKESDVFFSARVYQQAFLPFTSGAFSRLLREVGRRSSKISPSSSNPPSHSSVRPSVCYTLYFVRPPLDPTSLRGRNISLFFLVLAPISFFSVFSPTLSLSLSLPLAKLKFSPVCV